MKLFYGFDKTAVRSMNLATDDVLPANAQQMAERNVSQRSSRNQKINDCVQRKLSKREQLLEILLEGMANRVAERELEFIKDYTWREAYVLCNVYKLAASEDLEALCPIRFRTLSCYLFTLIQGQSRREKIHRLVCEYSKIQHRAWFILNAYVH